MNIIKKYIIQWTERVPELWAEQCYIRAILTFIIPVVAGAASVALIILGVTAIFDFLRRHYAQLIMVALGLWAFAAWWDKHRAEKVRLERDKQEVRERQDYSDRLEIARTKDATYTTLAKILFSVVRELGPLGIVPPVRLSDLYSPGRTVLKANGTVSLNLYLLQKDRESIDTDLLMHTLQTKIDQRLQSGEFPDIPEQHVYRGRVYSGFIVDMVRDSMGGFMEVYTVLVDDTYCRYKEHRNLNSHLLLPPVDRRDTDY